jgi:hypothetical protein
VDKAQWRRYDHGMVGTVLQAVTGADDFLRELFFDASAPVWTAHS